MMHRRRWSVSVVASAEDLARMLTERTWTLCSGFSVAGHAYLFLNDATCEDGAAEFGVIRGAVGSDAFRQVESITFSWSSYESGLDLIRRTLAGDFDHADYARPIAVRVETAEAHGTCQYCA